MSDSCSILFKVDRLARHTTGRRPKIKISVVIPAYNAERFMRRCLQSVLAQTLKPYEIIVADDGSTDHTAALAAELGAHVLSGPNRGISSARNSAIRFASGEWIALLDADDLWDPEKLERQVACIRPETVLVYTGIRSFDDKGIRNETPAEEPGVVKKMLRHRNLIAPSSALVRRDVILRLGGFREGLRSCEDWGMWMRMRNTGRFDAVYEPLTSYYIHPASLSNNPEVMLEGLNVIMNPTLLADLRGVERWVWRRRILATQLASAGLIARENGLDSELNFIVRSWCAWPSPLWQPRRAAILAVSFINKLRYRAKV